MNDINQSRRTDIEVYFGGVDISESIKKYLISISYTDNEEDETDDLQIKLHDREGVWLESWLNNTIQSAAERNTQEVVKQYKVISKSGVAVRSSSDKDSKTLGTLTYGTIIEAKDIKDGWVSFKYPVVEDGKTTDKTGHIQESYLQPIYKTEDDNSSASSSSSSNSEWSLGDEVTVNGRPQNSSYGTGTPGTNVSNYKGTITHLNLKDGVPYPIHVGSLGWFAINQVQKTSSISSSNYSDIGEEDEASKGLKIQASIVRQNWNNDGVDEKLECGQFELDNITASGPPSNISIKATSLPYSSTIRQMLKSKSWENYTLSGITNEIADVNGMTCMFLAKDVSYSRIEQYRISDIAFLQKLCQDAGYSLKITNNNIVIFDQVAYESKDVIRTITKGSNGGYSKYKLSTSANDTFTSCHVSYIADDGTLIQATAYVDDYDAENENNQCLEIKQKILSVAEALSLAKKMLRLHNKYEFTASFTFPGDPELLAGSTVELSGFGAWDNKYIIKQAKHNVDNSGYTTQITLRRALLSKEETDAETASENKKSIDELAHEVIRGEWGNGEERKRRLTEAGYDYVAVQARVNELLR